MAALNIENFPDDLHEKLRREAEKAHRSLAQQVIHLLKEATSEPETYSLMELRGLGKELWRWEDAVAYVARERGDWGSRQTGDS